MRQYVFQPAGEAENDAIHAGLRAYNRKFVPDTGDLSLAVKDADGRVVGGCDAFRMGELAFVDVLWVAEDCRGTGLGGCILDQVEAAGARQGARRVELNTFSFQAPASMRSGATAASARWSPPWGSTATSFMPRSCEKWSCPTSTTADPLTGAAPRRTTPAGGTSTRRSSSAP